ncbi:uncharacterized protein PAC_11207 [Phialocephala subalpina]|uniref:Uncharacterized protein n=1 Tax=Phialocephala subalpina TaxID=576137 RepID=A0A1L7X8G9_9HELO|nr:uncharacterized protein PAC_11207 [Phialocephala subalpina]
MLDPLTTLSLASSIIQIVDCSTKLITNGIELYKKGSLSLNDEIEQTTDDLKSLTEALSAIPRQISPADQNVKPLSNQERSLQQLAISCSEVGDELLDVLKRAKMQSRQSGWESMRKSFRNANNKKKINDLEIRLKRLQDQLSFHLLAILKDKNSSVISRLENISENGSSTSTKIGQLRNDIVAALEGQKTAQNKCMDPLGGIGTMCHDLEEQAYLQSRAQRILESLHFKAIKERQGDIKETYARTFEWVFSDVASETRPRSPFSKWLQSSDGIFWIAGKAGSGKSTLMKFLCDHSETIRMLGIWGGDAEVTIASHFFWSAGTKMQKLQEGLLQALLYQIFGQCPDIIQAVCPDKWKEASLDSALPIDTWTRQETFAAFEKLGHPNVMSQKFCFFVDGLDEYDGEHSDLLLTLQTLAKSSNIKLCVSSRPWNVFLESFEVHPNRKIVLQDFTKDDIRTFVRGHLEKNDRFLSLMQQDNCYMDLIHAIVEKAEGVFLWVYLVVRSLLRGLTEEDDIATLQHRLQEFPSALEDYFKKVFDNVEPVYRKETGLILQMMSSSPWIFTTLAVYFLLQENNISEATGEIQTTYFTDEEIDSISGRMRKRINARCKDLVEVESRGSETPRLLNLPRVYFIHRTAKDFLQTKHMHSMLQSMTPPTFDVYQSILRVHLAILKAIPTENDLRYVNMFQGYVGHLFCAARTVERMRMQSEVEILDEVETLQATSESLQKQGSIVGPFYCEVINHRLHLYLTYKLDNDPRYLQASMKSKLLIFALKQVFYNGEQTFVQRRISGECIDLTTIKLILERGTSPNQPIPATHADSNPCCTIWEDCLRSWAGERKLRKFLPVQKEIFEATSLLIRYGADLDLTFEMEFRVSLDTTKDEPKFWTVDKVMESVLKPSDYEKIKVLLAEKREASRREREPVGVLARVWKLVGWNS